MQFCKILVPKKSFLIVVEDQKRSYRLSNNVQRIQKQTIKFLFLRAISVWEEFRQSFSFARLENDQKLKGFYRKRNKDTFKNNSNSFMPKIVITSQLLKRHRKGCVNIFYWHRTTFWRFSFYINNDINDFTVFCILCSCLTTFYLPI